MAQARRIKSPAQVAKRAPGNVIKLPPAAIPKKKEPPPFPLSPAEVTAANRKMAATHVKEKKSTRQPLTQTQREAGTLFRYQRRQKAEEHQQATSFATTTHEQELARVKAKRAAERAGITQRGKTAVRTEQGVQQARAEQRVFVAREQARAKAEGSVAATREQERIRTRAYFQRHVGAPIATATGGAVANAISPFMLILFTMGGLIVFYLLVTNAEATSGLLGKTIRALGTISTDSPLFVAQPKAEEQ